MTTERKITLSEAEYKALRRAQAKLDALEAGGVDNWDWHDQSMEDNYDEAGLEADIEAALTQPSTT